MASRKLTLKHPDIHVRLREHSVATRQYFISDSLPDDAPFFELDQNGYPKVNIGERFCRWRLASHGEPDKVCGNAQVSRGDLLRHIEEKHGVWRDHRPAIKTNHDRDMCLEADVFYRAVMKHASAQIEEVEPSCVAQDDEEMVRPKEETDSREPSTVSAARSNSWASAYEPMEEDDAAMELAELDAEVALEEIKVKRLEAQEKLAEVRLRRLRFERRKSVARK